MGLQQTAYNVLEDVGEVEVCVMVQTTSSCSVPFKFSIAMLT